MCKMDTPKIIFAPNLQYVVEPTYLCVISASVVLCGVCTLWLCLNLLGPGIFSGSNLTCGGR